MKTDGSSIIWWLWKNFSFSQNKSGSNNQGTHQLICCPNLWVQWPIFEATSNLYCLWMLTVYAMKPRLQRKARNTPVLKVFPTIYMQAFVSKDQVSNSYTNERPKWTNIHSTTNSSGVLNTRSALVSFPFAKSKQQVTGDIKALQQWVSWL